jgi:potassium-transporting ATPase potassium-binding subunit
MIGDKKEGWALFTAATILFVIGTAAIVVADLVTNGTVIHAVGAATEGTETRFGVPGSAIFGQPRRPVLTVPQTPRMTATPASAEGC